MGERRRLGDVALDILIFAGMMTAGLLVARNLLKPLMSNFTDPDKEKHDLVSRQAKAHIERLSRNKIADDGMASTQSTRTSVKKIEELVLNEYENLVALEMVSPEDIHVGFEGMFILAVQSLKLLKE
ncbi:hypothetical protein E4U13_005657 [Claviceps humidiphila]|uniref:Uncharacterized protein n=2 Tax=Claviceps TaxID=5110 RepID=A0A9P7MN13_9HYPO|nr:hypothetical protein E4U57_004774 [Claviceps arundinis]KAG5960673.1 hypothetical protein E4U56_004226 [Claviceps arundinis]KAG6109837.1 hypothetical protein E4U13_005657 [Claviceps humidiphila]